MTRSSDLVMVEREVLANAVFELKNLLAMCEGEVPSLLEDHFSYPKILDAIEAGEAALQSVEGGVQVAAKQESCPESAPRTETAYKADRLRFAVGYLAKHAKGVSLSDWDKISNDILDAAKLLDACHDPERNEDEDNNVRPRDDLRDRVHSHPVAEPGYRPGNGGTLAHAGTRLAVVGDNRDSSGEPDADGLIRATNLLNRCLSPRGGDLYIGHIGDTGAQDLIADIAAVFRSRDKFVKWIVAYDCAQYEKLLAEAQLTKTPSADHDAGNLRGLAEPTPRDSSESTTGGTAPDHTTMEERGR